MNCRSKKEKSVLFEKTIVPGQSTVTGWIDSCKLWEMRDPCAHYLFISNKTKANSSYYVQNAYNKIALMELSPR